MVEEELRESAERAFQAYRRPLKMVTSFKYLGRFLTVADKKWPAVVGNLWKARKSRAYLARILVKKVANPRVSGMFFKVVLQAVLLYRSEIWVQTPLMGQSLGSFQHGVARHIIGRQLKRREEGGWEYPLLASAMEEVRFEEIGYDFLKSHNTVAQYIVTQTIMDLCKKTVWRPGAWVAQRWC